LHLRNEARNVARARVNIGMAVKYVSRGHGFASFVRAIRQ
jgi:hypothetical protein